MADVPVFSRRIHASVHPDHQGNFTIVEDGQAPRSLTKEELLLEGWIPSNNLARSLMGQPVRTRREKQDEANEPAPFNEPAE